MSEQAPTLTPEAEAALAAARGNTAPAPAKAKKSSVAPDRPAEPQDAVEKFDGAQVEPGPFAQPGKSVAVGEGAAKITVKCN